MSTTWDSEVLEASIIAERSPGQPVSGSPRTGIAPVRAVSWEVWPCRAGVGQGGLCVGGSGAGRSPSHRGLAGEPQGPAPLSCLQRSISQPLTLFLHLEGSERLTVSWLPG